MVQVNISEIQEKGGSTSKVQPVHGNISELELSASPSTVWFIVYTCAHKADQNQ